MGGEGKRGSGWGSRLIGQLFQDGQALRHAVLAAQPADLQEGHLVVHVIQKAAEVLGGILGASMAETMTVMMTAKMMPRAMVHLEDAEEAADRVAGVTVRIGTRRIDEGDSDLSR